MPQLARVRQQYHLKKLRGKNVVRKIATSRRYETVPEGLQAMAALLVLRDKVVRPVLAEPASPDAAPSPSIKALSMLITKPSKSKCAICSKLSALRHKPIDKLFYMSAQ